MRKSFMDQLMVLAKNDPNVWLLTADLGYSFLEEFEKTFPERFINVGVAEQNMLGLAAGLALSGKKIFVYSIINFLVLRAFDQIRNGLNYHNLDVTLVGIGEGFSYGSSGYTHHSLEDLNLIASLENFHIYTPGCLEEVSFVMKDIKINTNPKYLRLGKHKKSMVQNEIENPQILKQGKRTLIVSYGSLIDAIFLKGLSQIEEVKVIRFNKIKPFPKQKLLKEAQGIEHVIIVEEHTTSLISYEMESILRKDASLRSIDKISIERAISHIAGDEDYLRDVAGISLSNVLSCLKRQREKTRSLLCQ